MDVKIKNNQLDLFMEKVSTQQLEIDTLNHQIRELQGLLK